MCIVCGDSCTGSEHSACASSGTGADWSAYYGCVLRCWAHSGVFKRWTCVFLVMDCIRLYPSQCMKQCKMITFKRLIEWNDLIRLFTSCFFVLFQGSWAAGATWTQQHDKHARAHTRLAIDHGATLHSCCCLWYCSHFFSHIIWPTAGLWAERVWRLGYGHRGRSGSGANID